MLLQRHTIPAPFLWNELLADSSSTRLVTQTGSRFRKAKRHAFLAVLPAALIVCFSHVSQAQNANAKRIQRQQQEMQRRMQQQMKAAAENQPKLPADPQLLSLHKEFIAKAEKLAAEYERKKQLDQAREVYEAMVRLVPNYGPAEAGVGRIRKMQLLKDRKLTEVLATKGWQDSGAALQKGMPVHIEVKGVWKVVLQTGPEGIVIPDEARPKDNRIKLGTLIGVIANSPSEFEKGKHFIVKPGMDFTAEKSGHLYLRMFDLDPSDNEGKMMVLVQSSFGK